MDLTLILATLSTTKDTKQKSTGKFPTGQSVIPNYVIPAVKDWRSEDVKALEDNALHYVCGYLLKKVKAWHDCEVCNNILLSGDGYPKRNELFTVLKKFTNDSKLVNVSQACHYFVAEMEKKLMPKFESIQHERDVGAKLVACLMSIKIPGSCQTFPKHRFLWFFVQLRIYYLLKFINASFKTTNATKHLKQFSHK